MALVGPWRATLLSGILYAASQPPADFGPLILIAFVPWMLSLKRFASTRGAVGAGFFAGLIAYLFGLFYLSQMPSMGDSQGFMYFMWVFVSVLLAFVFGLFSGIARWVMLRVPLWWNLVTLPVLWVGFEYLHYFYPAPGPLLLSGYALHQAPLLIQCADLGSVHLVALFILLINACVFLWAQAAYEGKRKLCRLAFVVMLSVFALNMLYGTMRLMNLDALIKDDGPVVAMIQANITQDLKQERSEDAREYRFVEHLNLSKDALHRVRPDVILWSETSFPWSMHPERDSKRKSELRAFARLIDTPLIVGSTTPMMEADVEHFPYLAPDEHQRAWFNSAWLISAQGEFVARHDKTRLVPGGEYIPYRGTILGDMVTDYARSLMGAIPEILPGYRREISTFSDRSGRNWDISMNICYEFYFPQVFRELHEEKNVHFAMTLSNEAWYDGLAELDQALIMSRFRAIESRTTFARSTNTGITAVIDPLGRVTDLLEIDGKDRDVQGILNVALPYIEKPEQTVFLRTGMWVGWICMPLALIVLLWSWVCWVRAKFKPLQTH